MTAVMYRPDEEAEHEFAKVNVLIIRLSGR
jgi:hypothetical protein